MRRRLPSLMLLLVSCSLQATTRPIHFAPARTLPTGIQHSGHLAIADLNKDGIPDLVITSTYNRISVLLGKGDGTFQKPTVYALDNYVTGSVAIGDFNGDGRLDLAVVGGDAAERGLAILRGNGDGSFGPPHYYATPVTGSQISVIALDLNRDGKLDLFSGGNGSSESMLGNGDGSFQDTQVIGVYGFDVVANDFNGDGLLDVATTQPFAFSGGSVAVLLGNGDGTFQSPLLNPGVEQPLGVTAGDFNNDGKIDLAFTDYVFGTVTTLLGNGDGTFTNIGFWFAGFNPGYLATADFNMDGKLDLAVTAFGGDGISLMPGHGDGTFPSLIDLPTGLGPADVKVADVNNDGSPDLVVVNNLDETYSVLLNQAGTYLSLKSSSNPSKVGQPVTFAAQVTSSLSKTLVPTGTVTFKDGSVSLGSVPLVAGRASLTLSTLSAGSHNISFSYSGDGTLNPNRSAALRQNVQ